MQISRSKMFALYLFILLTLLFSNLTCRTPTICNFYEISMLYA